MTIHDAALVGLGFIAGMIAMAVWLWAMNRAECRD
jgi:hypothetical protein